jgi:DNA mismatch repair protein MutL
MNISEPSTDPHSPPRPIRPLDVALVNRIAAGEVIERPASVVKELVENALDAGATRLDIALEEGGVRLIRVSDDGCGIPADQLPLAIAPHATSKIATTDDLFNIHTLGFRGEALASIASVSQFRIVSRPRTQLEAYELMPDDNTSPQASSPKPQACSASPGTTIEVRNLFFNVPARRKFLRQAPTEMGHVTEQIARLALAHPDVSFSVAHQNRESRKLPATADRRSRIADFYGDELANCLLPIRKNERGLIIDALIAPPAQSRASSKWQYIFLNGRFISDRRINYAIREAFRGLVEHDRYPVVFLFLSADPQSFDVNVHPAKLEVRWRDAGLVQSQVLAVIRETLLSHDFAPGLSFPTPASRFAPQSSGADRQLQTRQAVADYLKSIDPTQARMGFSRPPFDLQNVRPSLTPGYAARQPSADMAPAAILAPEDSSAGSDRTPEASDALDSHPQIQNPNSKIQNDPPDRSVIQIHNTYLVAQTTEGIVIIDQHALHERILYEKFRARILAGPLESQGLLIPQVLEVSEAQMTAAQQYAELLHTLGIDLSSFGPRSLAVQAFPLLLSNLEPTAFVIDLLDKLVEASDPTPETLVHTALDMMACKAAIKAGDPLTPQEMHALLAQRELTDRASNCPHGRPTTLQLSTRDLEKQFKRI